jgi:hypothetical protein
VTNFCPCDKPRHVPFHRGCTHRHARAHWRPSC